MARKKVLVFPCGSEIALEIYRSLNHSIHFELIGANSVPDHGKFVYENYIEGIPFVSDSAFIPAMKEIVEREHIDFIYPAMDSVIAKLKENEAVLGCTVIASPNETAAICLSKEKTYKALSGIIRTPAEYGMDNVPAFPVFCKPKIGYGARGARKIDNADMLAEHLRENPDAMILEYLSGEEYTVDCFTDKNGELLFCGARVRSRISNGISVNTRPVENNTEFEEIASAVNEALRFRGAWFIQLKRNGAGELVLLEIASRLGGSSALFRARGINFAQLTLFDAMGYPVSVIDNGYHVEMDRALDNRFRLDICYDEAYIDYDDTLILDKCFYNVQAMSFIYSCKNRGVRLSLLSSHDGDLDEALNQFHLVHLFDRIIHVEPGKKKADYIDNKNAIFIDDSFAERRDVHDKTGIPVFSVDMIETLI